MLARGLGVRMVVGADISPGRRALAERLELVDLALDPAEGRAAEDGAAENGWAPALASVLDATDGGVDVAIDASGAAAGRRFALEALRDRGRCAFVGEGGTVELPVSPLLIHKQAELHGSWVTSLGHMAELLDRLSWWGFHPEDTVTDQFALADAAIAYQLADEGSAGKVCLVIEPDSP
jgi:threonine dehydrogenase-like Zn-dependent dehydrogenase